MKDATLTEDNFLEFAHKAVDQYNKRGMIVDSDIAEEEAVKADKAVEYARAAIAAAKGTKPL